MVTAQGRVVSRSPTLVLQPLETAIVRSINVHEGQAVQAGQVLARLDPTFAAADMGALAAQVASLQAQVSRLQAEADGQPFAYSGTDPNLALQAAIFGQRQSEYTLQARELHAEDQRHRVGDRQGEFRRGRLHGPPGGGDQRREDAAGPGTAAGRQQAEYAGGDGQPRRDGAQPARRGGNRGQRRSAISPRWSPSATATCSPGTRTSRRSWRTPSASCRMRASC